jgi:DNA-binding winged helix-turn-helix (wHTH) protein
MKLRIGDLSFDGGRRLLHRGAEPIHLSPKAFQLLSLLLARRPDAVSKAEIHEALWPGAISSEGNLASIVSEVRHALEAEARGETWVRTVHGFGYAFEGTVRETPDVLRHFLVRGHQEVGLVPGVNLLGREKEAAVRVGHPSVAREHARIVVTDDQAELEDLAGGDSTFRGTEAVHSRLVLKDGDVIRIGEVALTYRTRPAGGRS